MIGFKNRTHSILRHKFSPPRSFPGNSLIRTNGWIFPMHDGPFPFRSLPARNDSISETKEVLREDYDIIGFANGTVLAVYLKLPESPT